MRIETHLRQKTYHCLLPSIPSNVIQEEYHFLSRPFFFVFRHNIPKIIDNTTRIQRPMASQQGEKGCNSLTGFLLEGNKSNETEGHLISRGTEKGKEARSKHCPPPVFHNKILDTSDLSVTLREARDLQNVCLDISDSEKHLHIHLVTSGRSIQAIYRPGGYSGNLH